MEMLVLRLEAPMMSFGAPIVDNRGVIQEHPPLSMLTGLIGNALGYRHAEFEQLQRLQGRIRFAARCDRPGERFTDFQTVDLGQEFLKKKAGWTTRGEREHRRGGEDKKTGTHLRYRDYLASACYTVVLTLQPPGPQPDLDAVAAALDRPARPLFIGRKACLPASRLLVGRTEAADVLSALRKWPIDRKHPGGGERLEAWWPADLGEEGVEARHLTVRDQRDWANQIHTGQRELRHGLISVQGADGHAE